MTDDWEGHISRGTSRGGLDYAMRIGTPITAPINGRVENRPMTNGYGNYVRLHHGDGWIDEFLHLNSFVPEGNYLQGQVIGYSGNTGQSTGPHVHWHLIAPNGTRINPLDAVKVNADNAVAESAAMSANLKINKKEGNKMNLCHIITPQPDGQLKFLLFNDSFYLEFVGQDAANAFASQIGGNSAGVSKSFFDLVKAQVAKNQAK